MVMPTISEILFERFCQATDIPFRRVPTESATERRTPDYELRLGDLEVLAEVKQVDPNPEEKEARQRFEGAKATIEWQSELGARLRKKISEANSQLKSQVKSCQPAILVIYNNVNVLYGFTDPHNVMAAMYGQYEFVIGKPVNSKVRPC